MNIILASGSPRRRELLVTSYPNLQILSVEIDETPYTDEPPTAYIKRMISDKSAAAIKTLHIQKLQWLASEASIILTADTIGVLADGKTVLIKPLDRQDAYQMWQQMSDNSHQVWTAVQATKVVWCADNQTLQVIGQRQIIERTDVTFVLLSKDMMDNYWESGEPQDKAGGYAIQGLAAAWVSHIHGSYTNVVGLPLAQTLALIEHVNSL